MSILGINRSRRAELVKTKKAAVLNLHRVTPEPSPYWPPMHPELFESLLRYLDRHFEVRGVNELSEKQGARPIAVLSFDDGYYDFIEYALPLLRKYRMRANMNIIPQCVETGRPIWNVKLYDFLATASMDDVQKIEVRGFPSKLYGVGRREKLKYGMELSKYLKRRPRAERQELFAPIEELMTEKEFRLTRMMKIEEVRQIAGDADIGAHSYSHESMAFEEDEFFADDVEKCAGFFRSRLQLPMDIYAFPNGSYLPNQIAILREKGVSKMLLVDERLADIGSDVIPRITMYGDSASELRMRAVSAV